MTNYLYDIKLAAPGFCQGGIITNRKLGICRPNGGLVSVSITALVWAPEVFDMSQASNLTFDPATPGAAGLDGVFRGRNSVLTFFRLGTFRRLYTIGDSRLLGRTVSGFYSITWETDDAWEICRPQGTLPGSKLPM